MVPNVPKHPKQEDGHKVSEDHQGHEVGMSLYHGFIMFGLQHIKEAEQIV